MKKYSLYLDDIRIPENTADYILPVELKSMYRLLDWVIVRSYAEFVEYITKNGVPSLVSFDHDLAAEHYCTPQELWNNYEESKKFQEEQVYVEKTGLDCARWLCEYCLANKIGLPECFIHSMNPVGADNIRNLLNNYKPYVPKNL